MPEPSKKGVLATISYLTAGVAALALLVTNLETLHNAWCSNIGMFCAPVLDWAKSDVVYVFSGGTNRNDSDECKAHQTAACVRPSGPNEKLQLETARFEASERSGAVYVDGNPTNDNPIGTSNIGWFLKPGASPTEVCATVFARTSACETKVEIRGQLFLRQVKQ